MGLREERERLDAKKRKRPKIARKGKKLLQPVPTAPSSSKSTQKKGVGIRKNSLSLLSSREETEGEDARAEGGWGSDIEEYEDSSVDIDDILDPEEAPARRILRLEATQRPPVVTSSGRVVKVSNLEE